MPFCLATNDVVSQVAGFESVLIVPCRFCPAASMAVKTDEPYLQVLRRGFETASYERLIERTKQRLEQRGIRTGVFRSRLLHQFVLCMWTVRRRAKLRARAERYDAVLVMGCEAAVETVRHCLESTSCTVIGGMTAEGIMSIQPRLSPRGDLTLELESVTPYLRPADSPRSMASC